MMPGLLEMGQVESGDWHPAIFLLLLQQQQGSTFVDIRSVYIVISTQHLRADVDMRRDGDIQQ